MWYYSNGPGKDLHLPIMRSLGRVLRYHIGSLAFGSLILSITQFLELFVFLIKQNLIKTGAERSKFV
jgi:choline transporter-like protein 2/4/5